MASAPAGALDLRRRRRPGGGRGWPPAIRGRRKEGGGPFRCERYRVEPLGASQSLSATFPCTGNKAFHLGGKAPRGSRVARVGT